jgi:hypothetical protein
MCHVTRTISPALFITLLLLPMPARAIPAITCHCFTDRSFDPGRPALADPYFLATTQNSLFALVFNVDKKTIVMKKQQGASPDDLWVAYWVASKSGLSPESLLQAKQDKESWKDVVESLRLSTKALGARFSGVLNAKSSTARLADTVVDGLLLSYQMLGDKELIALRQAGASNQELIIATVISAKTRQSARQIYQEVKSGTKTWGALLQFAKIDTKNMQQEIYPLLKLHPGNRPPGA